MVITLVPAVASVLRWPRLVHAGSLLHTLYTTAEEVLHGMALISGADSTTNTNGPAGTTNPVNLFMETNAASLFYCTKKKKEPLSPINRAAIDAFVKGSAAAAAVNINGLLAQYAEIEKAMVARFLQYSLEEMRLASAKVSRRVQKNADACQTACIREAQRVGVFNLHGWGSQSTMAV